MVGMSLSPEDHALRNWLKTKVSKRFWDLSPACQEVARLTSESRDHPLPFGIRLRLGLHRSFCKLCARYAKHIDLVHEASHLFPEHADQAGGPALATNTKTRIKRAVHEALERQIVAFGGVILSLMARSLAHVI